MIKPYENIDVVFNRFDELYGQITDAQKERYKKVFSSFKEKYNVSSAYVASSSGRVEVCGNHTDHNGGKVVSLAISLDTLAMFLPTDDGKIKIYSDGYGEIEVTSFDKKSVNEGTSAALIAGVVDGLRSRGYKAGGFVAYFNSNVPGGSGVSSSASFEVLVAEIENFLYNDGKISNEEKAIVSQYAENVYFGKPCGLLDQTAIAFGGLRKLDFKNPSSISVSDIKCDLSDYRFVLINTGGNHADLTDEYAAIPREMFSVANAFNKDRLIDLNKEEFFANISKVKGVVSDRAILRAVHFYAENERVDGVENALAQNDFQTFLRLVNLSGESSLSCLQNCYVSGSVEQPIPLAISISKEFNPLGASRVHGGGFAGSILSIVNVGLIEEYVAKMQVVFGKENVLVLLPRSVGTIVL